MSQRKFIELSQNYFVDPEYKDDLAELGLISIEAIFSFGTGRNLTKNNLAEYRTRLQFEIGSPCRTLFLKRYDRPPILVQLKNWLTHRHRAGTMSYDLDPAANLAAAGINAPKTVAYGQEWGLLFEKRSFIIAEKIPRAESLEHKLPPCFYAPATTQNLSRRRYFIRQLARFARKFHQTGYRHRDFYFAHIFHSEDGSFSLIDLQRVFKPKLFAERFRIKDIAQLYYSAPGRNFSRTDRLRFYLSYAGKNSLGKKDKLFTRQVDRKVRRMARHDARHNRPAPFAN